MTTIPAAEGRASGCCGYAACGLARCGVGIGTAPAVLGTHYPTIRIYDSSMNWIGQTISYETFSIDLNFYEVHTFTMDIVWHKIDLDLINTGGFISYQGDFDDDPYVFMIESITNVMGKDGQTGDIITVAGRGVKAVLSARACMEEFNAGTGYDNQTNVTYETAIRHYITQEAIGPTDSSRNITGIALEAVDGLRGGTLTDFQARTESLLDNCVVLSKAAPLGFDLVWTGSGLNFTVTFIEGTDRTTAATATYVSLNADFRNILSYSYLENITDMKNVIYVGGTGTDASRALRTVSAATVPTGWNRRETFLDGSDCSNNTQLTEKGEQALVESAAEQSLEFEYNTQSQSYVYGRDFSLGDIVQVVYPNTVTLDSRLITVSKSYEKGSGEIVTLTVGKEKPDFIRIMKKIVNRLAVGGKK